MLAAADFFFSNKSFRNAIRVHMSNSLDPDQDQHSLRYIESGHRFYATVHLAKGSSWFSPLFIIVNITVRII